MSPDLPEVPASPKKARKSTYATVEERTSQVFHLLLNGAKRRDILKYSRDQGWGLKEGMVDRYIKYATDIIREINKEDMETMRSMSLNRHDDLYKKSMRTGDYATCLKVQRSRDEITGVRVNSLDLKVSPLSVLMTMTPEEVEKEVRKRIDRNT